MVAGLPEVDLLPEFRAENVHLERIRRVEKRNYDARRRHWPGGRRALGRSGRALSG